MVSVLTRGGGENRPLPLLLATYGHSKEVALARNQGCRHLHPGLRSFWTCKQCLSTAWANQSMTWCDEAEMKLVNCILHSLESSCLLHAYSLGLISTLSPSSNCPVKGTITNLKTHQIQGSYQGVRATSETQCMMCICENLPRAVQLALILQRNYHLQRGRNARMGLAQCHELAVWCWLWKLV